MSRPPANLLVATTLAVAVLALGCGGHPATPAVEVPPPSIEVSEEPPIEATPADSSFEQRIVAALEARLWSTIEVGRLREVAGGRSLVEVAFWGVTMHLAGVDPSRDFERAFLASRGAGRGDPFAVVVEHTLDEGRTQRFLEGLVQLGHDGSGLRHDLGVPAANVGWRTGSVTVIMAPTPSLLVFTTEALALPLLGLREAAPLNPLDEGMLVEATALDPAQSMLGRRLPPLPAGLRVGRGRLALLPHGAVRMQLEGECADAEQAASAAEQLNELAAQLLEARLSRLLSRLLPVPTLRSEGRQVVGESELSAVQLEAFMKLVRLISRSDSSGSWRLHESTEEH